MPDRRTSIYERAVEETMTGCGKEGYHSFGFRSDGASIDTEPRPVFDAAAKLAEIDAEIAKKVIPPKVD